MESCELRGFDYVHRVLPKFRARVTGDVVSRVAKSVEGQGMPARDMFKSDVDYVFCTLRPYFAALCVAFYHTRVETCVPLGRQLEPGLLAELDTTLVAEILDLR